MSKFYFTNVGLFLFAIGIICIAFAESDEDDSTIEEGSCRDDQMRCVDGIGCVHLDFRCDGDKDCQDGSDERAEICKGNCREGRFQCADGICIASRHICTGTSECEDGSDEDDKLCSNCNGDDLLIKCAASSKCVKKAYICDSDFDCGESDPSDEDPKLCDENCGGMEERFQCTNKKCIYNHQVCNGRNDCDDGSDEADETCANCRGSPEKTKCVGSNKCFSESDRCDEMPDCTIRDENTGDLILEDNTDEENCQARASDEND